MGATINSGRVYIIMSESVSSSHDRHISGALAAQYETDQDRWERQVLALNVLKDSFISLSVSVTVLLDHMQALAFGIREFETAHTQVVLNRTKQ